MIATFAPLQTLPTRKGDDAVVCKVTNEGLPTAGAVVLAESSIHESRPFVLKLEDGFEKRYGAKCRRCDLLIGYWLDKSQFEATEHGARSDVIYLLPGGLMSTEEMKAGRDMTKDLELVTGAAG